ncbi:hypothetical protein DFJ58DRAFT_734343 [Suillus subalutaceus]|uniref:uncharacterized protein n=1 Tax=Suillus subalutaceus TaxID=48586 RepID=UPI001B870C32|nr:uncharacterized protein DFJ58DRAFT_734343 [Suillus subalutaceus]KAG1837450.1 hypothetical protein DFJ58DRAFT_734343 [Suillus subalutaceus]
MARTKQTARKHPKQFGKVLQPYGKPVRVQHRAMNAAKHAVISRALPEPIRIFRIPVTKAELSMDKWDAQAPHRIHYGVPQLMNYGAEDTGRFECLRVPVLKDQRLLGYVPLPTRYRSSWVYLCYCVEYWLSIWKCWDEESKRKQKKTKKTNIKTQEERAGLVDTSRKNAGSRFLQAMVARRAVLEECMTNGVNDERIESLDEFIIRNHRDWLFMEFDELPDDADKYLQADPLHAGNKKLFETGWGVKEDNIPTMLGQADNAWMSKGLDLSEMFKRSMNAALKELKTGGEGIDIPYNENAELPDKWHESHEPPIRFISERKDAFLRQGFTLDEPLVFLYHCLRAEEEIERGDFLREIMDMLATDETRQEWSLRVDQLIDGEMTWDDFSNLVADELDLELDQRVNSMGPDDVELDLPFLKLDARIAVRAYLRNSTSNPDTAANIFFQSISRFSDPDANDLKLWDLVIKTAKPKTVTKVLKEAHGQSLKLSDMRQGDEGARLTDTGHTQPTPPAKVMQSNTDVDQAEAESRGNSPDNICLDSERSAVQPSWVPLSKLMVPSSHGHIHSNAGENWGDQLTTPSNTPPNHTTDAIVEDQDGSQFTAENMEDGRWTGSDNFIPESLFSLADVQQAIDAFSYDGISFNEFRNILLTDIPPIHVNTVQEALRTLDSGRADKKTLHGLLKTLETEEAILIVTCL